jgi:alkylation response protein AidB-like acyl-CoA dehydrogenase
MEFGLSEDQKLIDQTLRGFLADTMPLAEIRRVAESRSGFDDKLWTGLCELGLPGLLVDEAHGGAGLGMMDAAVVVEAMGYGAAPMPFIGTCVMAPVAIALAGNDDQRDTWLPGIASGDIRMAVACGSPAGATGRSDLALAGDRLSGEITGLLDSGGANHALVFLDDGGAAIVALDGAGVTYEPASQPGSHPPLGRSIPR